VALGSEQHHIEIPVPFDCRRLKSPSARVIMQRIKNGRLATQGLTAVLLFSTAFASSAAQVIQRRIPPPPAGVAQLSPVAACATDNTPRIGNINGTQSGIVFQPGSQLNIVGCGFGKNGQVYLSGGTTMQLKIDSWSESNILAQIDPDLGGVLDFGGVSVNVKPNGLPGMASIATNGFKAARETALWALPSSFAKYSKVYGAPEVSVSLDGKYTFVERNRTYRPFCPPVEDQEDRMQDIWQLDGAFDEQEFEAVGVDYQNLTDQSYGDFTANQVILVGKNGGAEYSRGTKSLVVTFQGRSFYNKVGLVGLGGGFSYCTSRYSVSLKLTGPRGVAPFK
jgi:hypothetical protein